MHRRPLLVAAFLLVSGFAPGSGPPPDRSVRPPTTQQVPTDLAAWRSTVPPYMPPALREQVDALRIAVAGQPTTTPELLGQRAPLLWTWANAYALTGRAIHPNLPQELANVLQGRPRARQVELYAASLDWYVKEMAFQDAFPSAIGTLSSEHLGPYDADGYATLSQVYTVGEAEIRPGGGFLVATRDHLGGLSIQTDDPTGDNWVSVTSDNPDVAFEVSSAPVSGMFSGEELGARYFPRPYFRVSRGTLRPGDRVTISTGDRSRGSRGLKLPSASSSALRVRVWVSLEDPTELFSLAELPFYSEGVEASALRGFGPSIVPRGEPVTLVVRSEDPFRNRATSGFGVIEVFDGGDRILRLTDTDRAYHEVPEYRFTEAGVHYLTARTVDGRLSGEFNPILVVEDPRQLIFWGETHGHTGFAEGSGTVDNFFGFAREDARLDFMTLSEHDLWMDDWEWEVLRKKVSDAQENGRFLTYLGYEWTRPAQLGGHHNVLFRTPQSRRRVEAQRAPEVRRLYEVLKQENDLEDVLVIPHAHNPGRWWESDHDVEHLVEIVSNHGTFEWLGRAFLREGFHLGFVGGSDDHIGHPGLRPLNSERSGSDNYGGMAAVLATVLDRDTVFDAMRDRRTYATNGQKIILQLDANGAEMGQPLPRADAVTLSGRAVGTAPISRIELVKNGEVTDGVDYLASDVPTGLLEIRFDSDTDPLERGARARGARRWLGDIEVHGARLGEVQTPDAENVYTEFARRSATSDQRVEFLMRTRGAPSSILLALEDAGPEASLEFSTTFAGETRVMEIPLGRASGEGLEIPFRDERWQDAVRFRWIQHPEQRDRSFTFRDRRAAPGDSYYVRITQTNGGMAWTSPVVMEDQPAASAFPR